MSKFGTRFRNILLLFVLLGIYTSVFAQGVTTAAMSGVVTDKDGQALPGATVIATHKPTGTITGTTTRADGMFNLNNLRVGGPYSLKVSFVGYNEQTVDNIILRLGQNYNIDFQLQPSAIQTNLVSVVADRNAIISAGHTGAATNVGLEQIQAFPTISRSFQDFEKFTPQFDGRTASAGSRNNRFNNIQIDGAQYNDLFGLGSTGAPGGQANTTPISLDAIQEFQVVIAPYDVRMSGFTGGGINAITRGGTNTYSGSVYYYGRNENFVGVSPTSARSKLNQFTESQGGLRLGGPILTDRLFFFVNGELTRRNEPTENTTLSTLTGMQAAADQVRNTLIAKYGYDPGNYGAFEAKRPSNKLFFRFDFNLSDQHKLTARMNYVDAKDDNTGRFGNQLSFSDRNYVFNSTTFSPVVQLTSTFSNRVSNELILGYTSIRDKRDPANNNFPSIRVNFNAGNNIRAGGEEFSQANQLDQDVFEFTDNLTFYMGSHVFTAGTHNEFFKFRNLFISNLNGFYLYNSVSDFLNGKIGRYQLSYPYNGDRNLSAKFGVVQLGAYIQDEWAATQDLRVTLGLRFDIPTFPDKPKYNPLIDSLYGTRGIGTDKLPTGKVLWSPRLGLNWDLFGDRSLQLRGGAGLFTGRIPYVWISNQYGNTGMDFGRVDITNPTFAFVPDPLNQPRPGVTPGINPVKTTEVDLTDKDFKMPQLARFNAAIDKALPLGMVGTLELIYSKSVNDLVYQDINLVPSTMQGAPSFTGNRLYFTKLDPRDFTNVVLMSNTSEGYTYNLTAQIQGRLPFGLYTNLAYTFNRAKDLNSVVSSQAYSQYQFNPVQFDPNHPSLATSNFEIRNRIMIALSYVFEFFTDYRTTISIFYNGQSGRPYSYTYNGNVNGDGALTNDLIYIPTQAEVGQMNMGTTRTDAATGKTFFVKNGQMNTDFENFIEKDDYLNSHRGQIMERNALREPWIHDIDLKIVQSIPIFRGHEIELSLDMLNVLNLFNKDWGWVNQITNQNQSILTYTRTTGDNTDVFGFNLAKDINSNPKYDYFTPDNLYSRWQMQLGARYSF